MLKAEDIARLRAVLLSEKTQFNDDESASAGDRATVLVDQQSVGRLSRMDALQRQAMARAAARRRKGRAVRIAAALHRMEDGEFGFCQDCGEEIDVKRLTLDPTPATCISCARG